MDTHRLRRVAANLFILFHLTMIVGSLSQSHPVGKAIRRVTGPYERLLGVYQNWDMFSPNAPRVSNWAEMTGLTRDGREVALPLIIGAPVESGFRWRYDRLGKFDRNVVKKERTSLRRGVAHGYCATYADQGPFRFIRVEEVTRKTPTPAEWLEGKRRTDARKVVQQVACP
jgi:hypothetical protein